MAEWVGMLCPTRHGCPMEEIDRVPAEEMAQTVVPAATLVIVRHGRSGAPAQLLLVERAGSLAFAGGATVFPGGKVDPADHTLAARIGAALEPEDAAARIAAVRETLEETGLVLGVKGTVTAATAAEARRMLLDVGELGVVLNRFGWTLDLASLTAFARWLPRHTRIRAFDTRFYLADLGSGSVDLVVDATENRHLFWASAREALDLADDGRIKLIFPTRRNLERLAMWPDFESCRRHAEETEIVTISPRVGVRDGREWLLIPSDAGYPVDGEPVDSALRG